MLALFSFSGIRPKDKWDPARLDDLYRPLDAKELRTVSLVDYSEESARDRAESAGWMRLTLRSTLPLTDREFALFAFNLLLDDPRFGSLWAFLADVLEEATFLRKPMSDLRINFITRAFHYSLEATPLLEIHTRDDGTGMLVIRGPGLKEKTETLRKSIAKNWGSLPMTPRQTGISRTLEAPWSVSEALRLGLEALVDMFPLSHRDFMTITGSSLSKEKELRRLRITTHGIRRFYHLHVPDDVQWREDVAALRATPPPQPKPGSTLSKEEREQFVATHRRWFPDVHDWSDEEILLAMFHGM